MAQTGVSEICKQLLSLLWLQLVIVEKDLLEVWLPSHRFEEHVDVGRVLALPPRFVHAGIDRDKGSYLWCLQSLNDLITVLLAFPVAEVLKVKVCDSRAAIDDLDDHIDKSLTRVWIKHAHPGDTEDLQLMAVYSKSIKSVSIERRTLHIEADEC